MSMIHYFLMFVLRNYSTPRTESWVLTLECKAYRLHVDCIPFGVFYSVRTSLAVKCQTRVEVTDSHGPPYFFPKMFVLLNSTLMAPANIRIGWKWLIVTDLQIFSKYVCFTELHSKGFYKHKARVKVTDSDRPPHFFPKMFVLLNSSLRAPTNIRPGWKWLIVTGLRIFSQKCLFY